MGEPSLTAWQEKAALEERKTASAHGLQRVSRGQAPAPQRRRGWGWREGDRRERGARLPGTRTSVLCPLTPAQASPGAGARPRLSAEPTPPLYTQAHSLQFSQQLSNFDDQMVEP